MTRILTGDRPTGPLHIGHYVGKIMPTLEALEHAAEAYIMVADYHAFTTHYREPLQVRDAVHEMVIDYLAAGIDPEKHVIFVQSQIPEHLELAYLIGALTPVSHLERVPTYKEKILETGRPATFALLGYPVLMAADIMVYRGDTVPVGDDQVPHLEFTRETVRRFNQAYGFDFPEPQPYLSHVPRLAGLDGEHKMSKSLHNQVDLRMTEAETETRVTQMVTDPQRIKRSDPGRPSICPAHHYYEAFVPEEAGDIAAQCKSAAVGCVACKKHLAGKINECFREHRERRAVIASKPAYVREVMLRGGLAARETARQTLDEVHARLGISKLRA